MKISGEQSESEKRVFSDCLKNSPDYTSYSAKTSFVITTSAGNLKSKATVRIIKDKILQISVQPFLGIEMFRVRLTNDSVWILDKMGKRYVAESIAAYKSKLPVDLSLSTISIVFGKTFFTGERSFGYIGLPKFFLDERKIGLELFYKRSVPFFLFIRVG